MMTGMTLLNPDSRQEAETNEEEKRTSSEEIDILFTLLSPWGLYQILQLSLAHGLEWPAVSELFVAIYTGYQPPVRCAGLNSTSGNFGDEDTGNLSDYKIFQKTCRDVIDVVNGSRVTGSCSHGYEYNQPKEASFASEWDLVCGYSYLAQLPSSMLIVGQMVGAPFFTALADKYGRRSVCIFSQVGMLTTSLASAWSPTITALIMFRFFTGAFHQGLMMCLSVLSVESLRTTDRTVFFVMMGVTWPLFEQFLIGLGYIFRSTNWRYLQLVLSGIGLITLTLNYFFLGESLRWLFARNKKKEVLEQLDIAIRYNKANRQAVREQTDRCFLERSSGDDVDWDHLVGNTEKVDSNKEEDRKATFLDIFNNRQLRITTCILMYIWIVNVLTYFGLILSSPKLTGNRFLNHCLFTLDSVPANFAAYFIITRFGRKVGVGLANAVTGVFLLIAVAVQLYKSANLSYLVLTFSLIGKIGNSASFFILFQYTPELYPTYLRSSGLGLSSSVSRLGGAIAPFNNLLIEIYPWAPGAIFGVLSLLSCLLVIILPETLHKQLPQSLTEMKSWKKKLTVAR